MKLLKSIIKNQFVVLAISLLVNTKVSAYSFTQDFNRGFYWGSFPIKMGRFISTGEDAALLEQLTNESVSEWESAVGKDIWELTPVQNSTQYSRNYIRWTNNSVS